MKKSEIRVQVAKDVLASLDSGRTRGVHGTYVVLDSNAPTELRPDSGGECRVCALGAAALQVLARSDSSAVLPLHMRSAFSRSYRAEYSAVKSLLRTCFSERQMFLVETAYEGQSCIMNDATSKRGISQDRHARSYCAGNVSADDRIRIIFQNIVDNGGTFKPEQKYEVSQ